MLKGNLTRAQVVAIVGESLVNKVESEDCDFTNRSMPGGFEDIVEFDASVKFVDNEGNDRVLIAYYYQDTDAVQATEDLGDLDWVIHGFEIW